MHQKLIRDQLGVDIGKNIGNIFFNSKKTKKDFYNGIKKVFLNLLLKPIVHPPFINLSYSISIKLTENCNVQNFLYCHNKSVTQSFLIKT